MQNHWLCEFGKTFGYGRFYEFLVSAEDYLIEKEGLAFSLQRQESLALYAYTLATVDDLSPFAMVNGFFRSGTPDNDFVSSFATDLRTAVSKLPKFQGIVFRNVDIPSQMRSGLMTGGQYQDQGFLSTSTMPNLFPGRNILLIQGSSGVNISRFSAFPHENEVLFLPGTKFDITRLEAVENGILMELTEQRND